MANVDGAQLGHGIVAAAPWLAYAGQRGGRPPVDPSTTLAALGEKRIRHYRRNTVISAQGEPADSLVYIQMGKVQASVVSESGKEVVVGILGAGDFFGEGFLAAQVRRRATLTTMTECAVLQLDKCSVLRLLRDRPEFSEIFIDYLVRRNVRMQEDLIDHLLNSSEKRLARLLLILASVRENGAPQSIVPKISQEMLAAMIGTTRPRVNLFMNKFRKMGFIKDAHCELGRCLEVRRSLLEAFLQDTCDWDSDEALFRDGS